jgi:L-2-hydroxycarboxylate dehydrogenase (NAD+)
VSVILTSVNQRLLISKILRRIGAAEEEARIQADVLTEADLMGVPSHGLQRLPVLVKRIQNGLLRVNVTPEQIWTTNSVLCVDGKDGFGPAIAETSLQAASPVAREHGVVAVALKNTSHLGMLGFYCRMRAEAGLICIGFTTSEALVHPYGGIEALVGTNPIAIGIPSIPIPFLFDMATSVGAMGKIIACKHRGERIPEGWALDRKGNPTTDPQAALLGSLAPVGGPKGYGLGVAIGILAGLLPGAEIGRSVHGTLDVEHRCTKGDLFLLLDPNAFPGARTLASAVGAYLDTLRTSMPQQGVERVRVPGDHANVLRQERLTEGIPHPVEVWEAITRLEGESAAAIEFA